MNKETLSTSKEEVPKIKLGLQDKYNQEKTEEPHAKRLDENNIKEIDRKSTRLNSSHRT